MDSILLGLGMAGLFISVISLGIGSWALIETMAMKRSTHKVQYVPVENPEATSGRDLLKQLHPELDIEEDLV
ncbi:MAG: hypothetical protein DRQ88_09355 [Epsilonproteobacteria bacterium]|nr:MAG: hypothetical protein DRQ88_09355 [Campylobacterota bacterium]